MRFLFLNFQYTWIKNIRNLTYRFYWLIRFLWFNTEIFILTILSSRPSAPMPFSGLFLYLMGLCYKSRAMHQFHHFLLQCQSGLHDSRSSRLGFYLVEFWIYYHQGWRFVVSRFFSPTAHLLLYISVMLIYLLLPCSLKYKV